MSTERQHHWDDDGCDEEVHRRLAAIARGLPSGEDPIVAFMDGLLIQTAIAATTPLRDPRLSEVDWSAVAAWLNEAHGAALPVGLPDVERLAAALTEVQGGAYASWLGRAPLILAALEGSATIPARPDHRVCSCGHTGSVHDAAPGTPLTDLRWPTVGYGPCHGRTEGDKACPCGAFEVAATLPSDR